MVWRQLLPVFAQRLASLFVPDKNGIFKDIVLGFNTLEEENIYRYSTVYRFGKRVNEKGNKKVNLI
ncbi:hypothetical protein [Aquimarina celericrescens]|uniref:Uncharacterized protein n=1 Tax=Aquimarina celericrescens TaxID=1964542 RepID=A0ABW5AXW5_9FLAO|nr:hypothetical protein [Aquimarina celericrescens]